MLKKILTYASYMIIFTILALIGAWFVKSGYTATEYTGWYKEYAYAIAWVSGPIIGATIASTILKKTL